MSFISGNRTRNRISPKTRREILERDNYTCKLCGFHKIFTIKDVPYMYKTNWLNFIFFKSLVSNNIENKILTYQDLGGCIDEIIFTWLSSAGLELDHIIPICFGGSDDKSNLQYLCLKCHVLKSYIDGS